MISVHHRFLGYSDFLKEAHRLRIVENTSQEPLLQFMEKTGMLLPEWRTRYPDSIVRRWWHEDNPEDGTPKQPVEPDGGRLDAAIRLENEIRRYNFSLTKASLHPVEAVSVGGAAFISKPVAADFVPWDEFRVDLSSDVHDSFRHQHESTRTLYAGWQILFLIEICSTGWRGFVNLLDEKVTANITAHRNHGAPFPIEDTWMSLQFGGFHAVRDLTKHRSALAALCRFSEGTGSLTFEISKADQNRRFMTPTENERYQVGRLQCAHDAIAMEGISAGELVECTRFLCTRWAAWKSNDRPLIAAEYRQYIGEASILLRLVNGWSFDQLKDEIGPAGNYFTPIMEAVFPSWVKRQSEVAAQGLESIAQREDFPIQLSAGMCENFVEWLLEHGQEAFLWRYRACNRVILGPEAGGRPEIAAEVQGLAVAVEGAVQAMKTKPCASLAAAINELWDKNTVAVLKRYPKFSQGVNADLTNELAKHQNLLSGSADERIAFYLLAAVRLRNGCHHKLITDEIEAEDLVVYLLTAALITYHHVIWSKRSE